MFRPRILPASPGRRAVILMVVLVLLTLFAIVGLAFVLYANAEAEAARVFRESNTFVDNRPDINTDQLGNYAFGLLIFSQGDPVATGNNPTPSGGWNAMRGYDLARDMYGYNADNPGPNVNVNPFNGVGRLHTGAGTYQNPFNIDDHLLLNYQPFLADGFVRDPERLGMRADLTVTPGPTTQPYTGGWNSSYTYPDANHVFLGAFDGNGNVLMPSFHRPWIFGSLDPSNPNWTNPQGKYLTLRPRPVDMSPNFPYPPANADGSYTGDVKNLTGFPGGNDSIWIDLDYPVQTAPDGVTKYKPLFAFFITDLDGRVNLNAHGNVLSQAGGTTGHASNQGWGPWEVNLSSVLTASTGGAKPAPEWPQLFQGSAALPNLVGRYGPDKQPFTNGTVALAGKTPHVFMPVDFNGTDENNGFVATGQISLPTAGTFASFPYFPSGSNTPSGYGNGSPAERTNHPLLYNINLPQQFMPGGDTRFGAANLTSLLTDGTVGSPAALACQLGQLLPNNMAVPRTRRQITTDSAAVGRPGLTPWLFDRSGGVTPNGFTMTANPHFPPAGGAVGFPGLALRSSNAVPGNSEFLAPGAAKGSAQVDWRAVDAALGVVDLNRFLPPYPHQGYGTNPGPYDATANPSGYIPGAMYTDLIWPGPNPGTVRMGPYDRFDDTKLVNTANIVGQYQAATLGRQQLANDIYRRLLAVTGVPPAPAVAGANANGPFSAANPGPADLAPRRWLAQLAANIVDFIDEDDISTPFNFYNQADGLPAGNIGDVQKNGTTNNANDPELPKYWVFGTELPRVVVNEAMAEYSSAAPTSPVNVFVELFNPMPSAGQAGGAAGTYPPGIDPGDVAVPASGAMLLWVPQANDGKAAYSPYIVVVADNNLTPQTGGLLTPPSPSPNSNDVPLGTPDSFRSATVFNPVNVKTVGGQPANPHVAPQQFFLVGPGDDANHTISKNVPKTTAMLTDPTMTYSITNGAQWQFKASASSPTPPSSTPPPAGAQIPDKTAGVSVLLRRLANPHLPYDPNALVGGKINPVYNPYVTVDYMPGVMPQDINTTGPVSFAKPQPYRSNNNGYIAPPNGAKGTTQNSFGLQNVIPQTVPYDWLTHLDRQLISPMELLHVSGFQPHELTQRFLQPPPGGFPSPGPFGKTLDHRVNWFDPSNRLYRAFEFLTTRSRATGVSLNGRIPGQMNINTIWDPEVFRALCDAQTSNGFTPAQVDAIFKQLVAQRSPGQNAPTPQLGPTDRPFLGMGTGNITAGDPVLGVFDDGTAKPNNTGIEDTFLRSFGNTGNATDPRLFEVQTAGAHPYQRTELMTKIFGNVTTRSNVFAVWCTVGFFQVVNENVRPVQLGAELGLATGTNIRHQLFAVIDRTRLTLPGPNGAPPTAVAAVTQTTSQITAFNTTSVSVKAMSDNPPNVPVAWRIDVGTVLLIDAGTANEETVIVQSWSGNNITAAFEKSHGVGAPVSIPGNPGPQPGFSLSGGQWPGLVAAYAVLR